MGWILSTNLGKNLDMAVSRPSSRCTFLMFLGLLMSMIAWCNIPTGYYEFKE